MRIKKGDTVQIIAGEARGKTGKVLKVFPRRNRVLVEGINFVKRHTRPSQQNPQGGIIEKEAPVHLSNVMLLAGGSPTRVGHRRLQTGRKIRVARKTGEDIDS
ncbi:MAG: 50S ribosomal protein L24 [Fidelibacterota bacterium]